MGRQTQVRPKKKMLDKNPQGGTVVRQEVENNGPFINDLDFFIIWILLFFFFLTKNFMSKRDKLNKKIVWNLENNAGWFYNSFKMPD